MAARPKTGSARMKMTRVCATCKVEKALESDFHRDRTATNGRSYYCKSCVRERVRRYDMTHPGAARARSRKAELKRIYGIDLDQYDEMFRAQGGLCAICGAASDTKLCVDHCHTTGRVRGLLCQSCNRGLGQFRDNPDFLARAIKYLSE